MGHERNSKQPVLYGEYEATHLYCFQTVRALKYIFKTQNESTESATTYASMELNMIVWGQSKEETGKAPEVFRQLNFWSRRLSSPFIPTSSRGHRPR